MRRLLLVLCLTIPLINCSRVPLTSAIKPASWATQQQTLLRLQSWQLEGKIALIVAQQSATLFITWQQYPNHYQLQLTNALGINNLKINGNEQQVSLQSGQKTYQAATAELLLQKFGWILPISYLNFWIRGLTAPHIKLSRKIFNAQGELQELIQGDWHINYLNYRRFANYSLPTKMLITAKGLRVKIIIYRWNLSAN